MSYTLARIHHDLTLNVNCPITGKDAPSSTKRIQCLNKDASSLNPELRSEFDASLVTYSNSYRFDVVIMRFEVNDISPTQTSLKNQDIFPLLLKDASSVDVCFEYQYQKNGSTNKIRLWAHSVILSRHKAFARLIQDEKLHHRLNHKEVNKIGDKDKASGKPEPKSMPGLPEYDSIYECDSPAVTTCSSTCPAPYIEPLVIKVENIALETMCTLLHHLYTNEIRRSFDSSRFVISCITANDDSLASNYYPSNDYSSNLPDRRMAARNVSWYDLLDAAKHFEILDLYAFCQYKIVKDIDQYTVVPILFSSCGEDYAVKKVAMKHIDNNLAVMFPGNHDPFEPYKDDPACHNILVELIRIRSRKVSVGSVIIEFFDSMMVYVFNSMIGYVLGMMIFGLALIMIVVNL
ncbi:hypothetical protein EC991_005417 [Linnemannia zychae]|nr:hypothetical protein EC991_005417 [Linnemannia zychae]